MQRGKTKKRKSIDELDSPPSAPPTPLFMPTRFFPVGAWVRVLGQRTISLATASKLRLTI